MLQLFPVIGAREPQLYSPVGAHLQHPAAPASIYDRLDLPPPPGHRPYTMLNMVSTVDGKVTLDGARVNDIGSALDHQLMLKLRVPVAAVIRGAGTVWSHGRYPSVGAQAIAARRAAGRPDQPLAVIVSGSGRLPLTSSVFQTPPRRPLVITQADLPAPRQMALAAVAHVIAAGGPKLDLAAALALLRRDYGVDYMLAEGGPGLNYTLLQQGLLDEVFWTVAPKIGGGQADTGLVSGPGTLTPMPSLALVSAYHYRPTGELFMRYRVIHDPARLDGAAVGTAESAAKTQNRT